VSTICYYSISSWLRVLASLLDKINVVFHPGFGGLAYIFPLRTMRSSIPKYLHYYLQ